jgi:hypothetical protein
MDNQAQGHGNAEKVMTRAAFVSGCEYSVCFHLDSNQFSALVNDP